MLRERLKRPWFTETFEQLCVFAYEDVCEHAHGTISEGAAHRVGSPNIELGRRVVNTPPFLDRATEVLQKLILCGHSSGTQSFHAFFPPTFFFQNCNK